MRIGTVNMKGAPSTRTLSTVAGYRCGLPGVLFAQLHRVRNVQSKGRDMTSKASQGPIFKQNGDGNPTEDQKAGIAAKLIESELHVEANKSYLSYALSVIIGRALPDARDGLKPVHRRVLYAMDQLGLDPKKPHRKCARVVGEVLGKFHPHGDVAVYDSLVRMAQSFTLRHPLVEGHGNFGSQDDDPPAAMRYTECRLSVLTTDALLKDLDMGTVNFIPNFDVSTEEPTVLPAKIPNLLVNGSQGIAVGMATNIPPHNLSETVHALIAYIDNPEISIDELMTHLPGPDFPTGGLIISGKSALRSIYTKGSGGITLRGKSHIETQTPKKRESIVITEIPYQVSKSALIEQIAQLVDKGKLVGITDVRDESDRQGMRIVVQVATRNKAQIVLNNLYQHTRLQQRYSYNMTAVVQSQPRCLNLIEFFQQFLDFRVEVIQNKAKFELKVKSERSHIVEGYLKVVPALDEVIKVIRNAKDGNDAQSSLSSKYDLTKKQALAVLALPLRRLTSLEVGKAEAEYEDLQKYIKELEGLLTDHTKVLNEVKAEALQIVNRHANDRKTDILSTSESEDLELKDLIPNEPSIIIVTEQGYIKRMNVGTFQATRRNAKGKNAGNFRSDDEMALVLHVHAHDTLLCFSSNGKVFSMLAHEVPEASRTSMGVALPRILKGWEDSDVTTVLPVSEFTKDKWLVLLSQNGMVKKTSLSYFKKVNSRGKIAMDLVDGDKLGWVRMSSEGEALILASKLGQLTRFPMNDEVLRPYKARGRGVISMRLSENDSIIGMDIVPEKKAKLKVLFVTTRGMSKQVPLSSFRTQARGGKGTICIKLNELDSLYAIRIVDSDREDELLVATLSGKLNRYRIKDIRSVGRTGKGVMLMRLSDNDRIQSIATIAPLSTDK